MTAGDRSVCATDLSVSRAHRHAGRGHGFDHGYDESQPWIHLPRCQHAFTRTLVISKMTAHHFFSLRRRVRAELATHLAIRNFLTLSGRRGDSAHVPMCE